MREPNSIESEHLYQSLWWTRLAAFSEQREHQVPGEVRHRKKERSSVVKTLAALFRGFHSNQKRAVAQFSR